MCNLKLRIGILCAFALGITAPTMAQDANSDLYDLSLQELMNIEIVSASKKAESTFDAPLSSTVVTKSEIEASGATTIEEALRLVPGMIVREESNGNFDTHIRGNDNLPPGNFTFFSMNNMTLVMIDGRPVYNYANGGTFWETLPIGLVDVERIEVVRGPASALYGPNAVTGVINIITTKSSDKPLSVNGSFQAGTINTRQLDLSVGSSVLDNKLKMRVSGNYETCDRDQETYYSFATGQYMPGDQVPDYTSGSTSASRFPDPEKSKARKGLNAFADYTVNNNVDFHVSAGWQDSHAQAAFMESTASILTNRTSTSKYVAGNANIHGLNAQVSLNSGTQNLDANGGNGSKLDFSILNTTLEYELGLGRLSLRPGINFQQADYTDLPYGGKEGNGYLNADRKLNNIGYYLRGDYNPVSKLRLIAALRMDKYNVPNDNYLSYQFIGTYKLNDNQLFRAVYSKANRGPFMVDSYADVDDGNGVTSPYIQYLGNDSLHLPVMHMFELGYRGKISAKSMIDVEVFSSKTDHITSFEPTYLGIDDYGLHLIYSYKNIDLVAKQFGATVAFNYAASKKLQFKVFGTVQRTTLENYDKKLTPVVIDPSQGRFDLPTSERITTTHKQTPAVYGGLIANYHPIDKLNVSASLYYLGAYTYRHDYASYNEDRGQDEVPGKATVNLKASYDVVKQVSVFVNARNLLNNQSREFGFADAIGGLYLAGLQVSF